MYLKLKKILKNIYFVCVWKHDNKLFIILNIISFIFKFKWENHDEFKKQNQNEVGFIFSLFNSYHHWELFRYLKHIFCLFRT